MQEALFEAHRSLSDFRGATGAELACCLRKILARRMEHAVRDHTRQWREVWDIAFAAVGKTIATIGSDWQGRFKAQLLLGEASPLACAANVERLSAIAPSGYRVRVKAIRPVAAFRLPR